MRQLLHRRSRGAPLFLPQHVQITGLLGIPRKGSQLDWLQLFTRLKDFSENMLKSAGLISQTSFPRLPA